MAGHDYGESRFPLMQSSGSVSPQLTMSYSLTEMENHKEEVIPRLHEEQRQPRDASQKSGWIL